jgi:hypothetical protein
MAIMEWILQIVLVMLLGATLLRAVRLELLVRSARPLAEEQTVQGQPGKARADKNSETAKERGASQVERDLLQALRMAR